MPRTLIIGFGNLDRADDGVAFHVVNKVRKRIGKEPLGEEETGMEGLGSEVDSIFVGQLVPEMIELLRDYERVIFVDAHVDPGLPELHEAAVVPEEAALTFTHHLSPAMLLAFLKALYGRDPEGHLVSVRGRDFDFHRTLSPDVVPLLDPAVDAIMNLLGP